jgi:hypothetical protein
MHKLFALLLVTGTIAAVAVGCGSDDSGSSSESGQAGSITNAKFVTQANTICLQARNKMRSDIAAWVRENGSAVPHDAGVKASRATLLPTLQSQVEEIRELGAPDGEEDQVDAFLAAMQDAVDANMENDVSLYDESFSKAFSQSGELARALGINACAYGSTS